MATPLWEPGKLYPPGSLVRPRTVEQAADAVVENAGFETGDLTGWTAEAGLTVTHNGVYQGNWALELSPGTYGFRAAKSNSRKPVVAGQVINAQAMIHQGASSTGNAGGMVQLYWYDEDDNELPTHADGNNVNNGSGGAIHASRVRGVAPANAAFVRGAIGLYRNGQNHPVNGDSFTWDYQYPGPPDGLIFKAVQPETGYSDNVEPTWPNTTGVQVIDNQVIWEGVIANRVVWQARPIMRSGPTEPNWPITVGGFVSDGTISWECVSRRVVDPKCPNSPYVLIAASKIFAADDDIVPFSATANPLDWSSVDDAGYLPSGLQQYGANPAKALGLYRGDVVPWNSQGMQVWQVNENPELMQLRDAFPVGSEYHHAVAPVSNDLFFLTQLGVRTVGVAGGSTNLQAGDIGMPIDPLVQAKLRESPYEPMGLYVPAQGQYWLIFGDEVFVYTMNQLGKIGAWSRYVFPWVIDDWTILGSDLYLRHGDEVSKVDVSRESDELVDDSEAGKVRQSFEWTIEWPYLDFGAMGVTKQLIGFDIVGTGVASIQFGYDQTNDSYWTDPWQIVADNVPGQVLMMPLAAPTIAVRLTYTGNDEQPTGWDALNLYLQDFRTAA